MLRERLNGEVEREARRHGVAHRLLDLTVEWHHDNKRPPKTFEELLEVIT